MSKWDGLNRRKFPRINYPCLVVIDKGDLEGADEVILTHTENVGIGGVCLILKKDVKMFTTVTLELDLLDLDDHIKCEGKIVSNVPRKPSGKVKDAFYDIGIEFNRMDDKSVKRLDDVVRRLVKNNSEV